MKPFIVLNLKAYKQATGARAVELSQVAAEVSMVSGVRVIVCPQAVDLREVVRTGVETFAQHSNAFDEGAYTGWMTAFAVKDAGAKGSLVNHAEHKIPHADAGKTILKLRELGLESLACADSVNEAKSLALLKPDFIAVEPPELIGKGVSVSTAKPEIVTDSLAAVHGVNPKLPVLCGAGVSTPEDVKKAIQLGTAGVLLASAFVKAPEPRELLEKMCAQL